MASIKFLPGPPDEPYRSAQIIGISELGYFLRLPRPETVHVWAHRAGKALQDEGRVSDHLPEYDYESINGCRAWRRITVVRWAARTNRLPPWLHAEGAAWWKPNEYRRPRRTKAEIEAARARPGITSAVIEIGTDNAL